MEAAAKTYLHRLSVIWSSPLSDRAKVVVSNQYALPVLTYLMWTQTWLIANIQQLHGRIQDFFLGGSALVSCSTSTPINHIVFFGRIPVVLVKPRVISGGGGRTPCTLPLDPPLSLTEREEKSSWRMEEVTPRDRKRYST